MAKPSIYSDIKFKRLVARLGVPRPHIIGYLDCLWRSAYEKADPYLGSPEDVELACEWPGEPGVLFDALLEAGGPTRNGFIELVEGTEDQYQIHDLFDHAPRYVRLRYERRLKQTKDLRLNSAHNRAQPRTKRTKNCITKPNQTKPDQTLIPPTPLKGDDCATAVIEEAPPTERSAQPPEFDDRIPPLWEQLSEVQTKAEPGRKPMKLDQRRRYAISAALEEHSPKELIEAWRWCLTSPSERAQGIRLKWAGIDTFLREPLKYVEQSQSPDANNQRDGPRNNFDLAVERMKQRDAAEEARRDKR